MKKIFCFAILLLHLSFYAQPPRGNGNGRRTQQNQQRVQNRTPKKFKASEVAGLFFYDIKKVVKKLKIKDDNKKTSFSKLLRDYNFKIKEIKLINADKFKKFDKLVNAEMQLRRNSGNHRTKNDDNGGIREKVQEFIRPIRQKVREKENSLNEDLAKILSKKQNKKWLKLQKNKKDKLKPKKTQTNNNQRQNQGRNQRGNRQRGGF